MRKLKIGVWPFQMTTHNLDKEIDKWCEEYLGHRFQTWYSYFINDRERVLAFKESETLLIFKLKWNHNDKKINA